jgi:hypothetical protein
VGNAGGNGRRGGTRTRRATVSKGDNIGPGDNESIEIIGVDVWPDGFSVHSRQGGEFAGGWLVCSSVLHVDLNAAWIVLGLSDGMKCNDLVAKQVVTRGESGGDRRGPFATLGNQLVRSPLSICVPALVDLKPLTSFSLEGGTISVARSHEGQDGALVVHEPVGPLESHVAASIDSHRFGRTVFATLVTGDIGIGGVYHGTIVWNFANDPSWHRTRVWIGER